MSRLSILVPFFPTRWLQAAAAVVALTVGGCCVSRHGRDGCSVHGDGVRPAGIVASDASTKESDTDARPACGICGKPVDPTPPSPFEALSRMAPGGGDVPPAYNGIRNLPPTPLRVADEEGWATLKASMPSTPDGLGLHGYVPPVDETASAPDSARPDDASVSTSVNDDSTESAALPAAVLIAPDAPSATEARPLDAYLTLHRLEDTAPPVRSAAPDAAVGDTASPSIRKNESSAADAPITTTASTEKTSPATPSPALPVSEPAASRATRTDTSPPSPSADTRPPGRHGKHEWLAVEQRDYVLRLLPLADDLGPGWQAVDAVAVARSENNRWSPANGRELAEQVAPSVQRFMRHARASTRMTAAAAYAIPGPDGAAGAERLSVTMFFDRYPALPLAADIYIADVDATHLSIGPDGIGRAERLLGRGTPPSRHWPLRRVETKEPGVADVRRITSLPDASPTTPTHPPERAGDPAVLHRMLGSEAFPSSAATPIVTSPTASPLPATSPSPVATPVPLTRTPAPAPVSSPLPVASTPTVSASTRTTAESIPTAAGVFPDARDEVVPSTPPVAPSRTEVVIESTPAPENPAVPPVDALAPMPSSLDLEAAVPASRTLLEQRPEIRDGLLTPAVDPAAAPLPPAVSPAPVSSTVPSHSVIGNEGDVEYRDLGSAAAPTPAPANAPLPVPTPSADAAPADDALIPLPTPDEGGFTDGEADDDGEFLELPPPPAIGSAVDAGQQQAIRSVEAFARWADLPSTERSPLAADTSVPLEKTVPLSFASFDVVLERIEDELPTTRRRAWLLAEGVVVRLDANTAVSTERFEAAVEGTRRRLAAALAFERRLRDETLARRDFNETHPALSTDYKWNPNAMIYWKTAAFLGGVWVLEEY